MAQVWHSWGSVLAASGLGVPLAGLVAALLARLWPDRPVRYVVAEVFAVAGTLPWLWMILTPSPGTPTRLNLVPLRDLAQLPSTDLAVQIGGNLLVFAALGLLVPVRFAVPLSGVLLVAAAGSVTVETLQYLLDLGRVSSVDDVLVNTAGALLATLCSAPWWRRGRYRATPSERPACHTAGPCSTRCS